MIPRDQVEEMSVGPNCLISEGNLDIADKLAKELQSEHESNKAAKAGSESSKELAPCSPPA